jgi:tRNA threonylcarbamoyladenosine modification (KEOPS) complex Cgi121 subunit
MMVHLEKYGQFLEISGFHGVNFELAEKFLKKLRAENSETVDIQFFNADLIATKEHLHFAALNALESFKSKTNTSKTPAMETMLYAATQNQIQRAIQKIGINRDSQNVAVVILGKERAQVELALMVVSSFFGCKPDESVLELTEQKQAAIKQVFQITDVEIQTVTKGNTQEAIVNLIIEREALLSTQT